MNKQEIEKAIEVLNNKSQYLSNINLDAKKAYALAISALQQQLTNGWIPVRERLPEEKEYKIKIGTKICYPEFNVTLKGIDHSISAAYDGTDWIDAGGYEINHEVIAWQPLPQPYKEVTK